MMLIEQMTYSGRPGVNVLPNVLNWKISRNATSKLRETTVPDLYLTQNWYEL